MHNNGNLLFGYLVLWLGQTRGEQLLPNGINFGTVGNYQSSRLHGASVYCRF